ncbi:SRPBCC family protein [Actinocrispum wychmicini]|uniref:Uncharacterized protein YndB with AHSA1/START domain n=1 Tax=Actinocrispum wychmicini TaxID=1213861 RepID=A0A4R2JNU6_9PSEU|nr:SRPBCC family protein [Actinocrispum wychmicini]TCO61024.1 uncharacterized protein YndB with AHSA1/START domain [Actinocrispum wychmicini]
MIDVTQQISAVRRHVGTRVLEAGEARVLTLSQSYDTDIKDLWDACTNVDRIPRWFLPVTGELRVGGQYQLTGNAGGTVERCDPPKSFAATWEYGGEVSWIEVRLSADPDGRARFELEHVAHVDDKRWAEFGPGAVGVGWDGMLMGLTLHLTSGGERVDPQEVIAFMMSPEGLGFVTSSSELWRDESIAAGTPADEANAAADRVTAFYTTPPES